MPVGRIVYINPERGFGFLKSDTPPFDQTFVHFRALHDAGIAEPALDMAFAYSIVPDRRSGKQQAADLELLESVSA